MRWVVVDTGHMRGFYPEDKAPQGSVVDAYEGGSTVPLGTVDRILEAPSDGV